MPAAAVAGGAAIAGLAGQYFAAQAQKEAAAKGANAQVQAQAMAIGAQRDAEERARQYYEPFRQLGLRAATPISDSNYAQMTGRGIIGQGGWRVSSSGTPYQNAATQRQNAMLRNTAAGNFNGGFGGGGFGGRGFNPSTANISQPGTVYQNPRLNIQNRGPVTNALTSFLNARNGSQGPVRGNVRAGGGRSSLGGGITGARTLIRRKR
jgi:hypothetical protein